jgi:hypothetical protein
MGWNSAGKRDPGSESADGSARLCDCARNSMPTTSRSETGKGDPDGFAGYGISILHSQSTLVQHASSKKSASIRDFVIRFSVDVFIIYIAICGNLYSNSYKKCSLF